MKRAIAAALLALVVSGPAMARDWTAQEKRWAAGVVVFTATDWLQTRHIARNPDKWREMNPLLPRHPSIGRVNMHFARSLLTTAALAHWLPEYRLTILRTIAVYQFGVTARNAYIGIKLEF